MEPIVADIDGSVPDRLILGQVTAENQLPQPHHLVSQAYSHTRYTPDGDIQITIIALLLTMTWSHSAFS